MKQNCQNIYQNCNICPRSCRVNRHMCGNTSAKRGYCGQTSQLQIARAALHMWEEPCISGSSGSGTIFFCGCQLKCVFCQNALIATANTQHYPVISSEQLVDYFYLLKEQGANNINLVTGDHYIPTLAACIDSAKQQGFDLPFIYNTGSYVSVDAIQQLDGLIDVYLPDLKYYDSILSSRYSKAPDYFTIASATIEEMTRQTGAPLFQNKWTREYLNSAEYNELCDSGEELLIRKGTVVRHLLLPGCTADSKHVLRYLLNTYGDYIYISIMNQYTPMPHIGTQYPELNRKVTSTEYDEVLDFAISLGIENGFLQEGDVASESFIPDFKEQFVKT